MVRVSVQSEINLICAKKSFVKQKCVSRSSSVRLFATPWTVACQAPLSMGWQSLPSVIWDWWQSHLCPGEDTGMGNHFLLQGIFPIQGSNPCLLHCRQFPYRLSHQGSSKIHESKEVLWSTRSLKHNLSDIMFFHDPPKKCLQKFPLPRSGNQPSFWVSPWLVPLVSPGTWEGAEVTRRHHSFKELRSELRRWRTWSWDTVWALKMSPASATALSIEMGRSKFVGLKLNTS